MPDLHVLNLGAGVQSTTIYLLNLLGDIMPSFDCAIFADTQDEPQAVYNHLGWLLSLGGPFILSRTAGKLGDDLRMGRNSTGGRCASIPAYTALDHLNRPAKWGREGRTRRQCTREYKIDVIERAIRRDVLSLAPRKRIPKGVVVHQYFGISLDEARRSKAIIKRSASKAWAVPHFPLLELGWTRADCIRWLEDKVPHKVPRSACVFCPYHSNAEWLSLKRDDLAAWNRAVEIDEALRVDGNVVNRNMTKSLYLHRSCLPLVQIDFEKLEAEKVSPLVVGECEGMCGV